MTEEIEQEQMDAASVQPEVEPVDHEPKMVPLAALQDERRKRQELEARTQVYEDILRNRNAENAPEQPEEDPTAIVERKDLQANLAHSKRDILETLYQDMNPKAVQEINKYLKPILEKKPWLAASVDTAQNRYARAHEIVQDYMHLVEDKPATRTQSATDGKRIIENSRKPGSPVDVGKSARPEGTEYLKSIQGKKEFREYREKVLRGEA